MTTFQIRLEQALSSSDMTPAELSRRTGLSPSLISYYRSGKTEPKIKQLYLIATALNVSPSWLMGFDAPENETALDSALASLWNTLDENLKHQAVEYIRFLKANQTKNT